MQGTTAQLLILDDHSYADQSRENPAVQNTPQNLSYVIYTSGTTGNPKGVLQMHHNVVRLFLATQEYFHFTDKDVWTLFHSYAFDFSVWEIWGALLHGGQLIIPTYLETRDIDHFYQL